MNCLLSESIIARCRNMGLGESRAFHLGRAPRINEFCLFTAELQEHLGDLEGKFLVANNFGTDYVFVMRYRPLTH